MDKQLISMGAKRKYMLSLNDIFDHAGLIYQPLLFPEYNMSEALRMDCEERYQTIKKDFGNFVEKKLIDICCSNGFFLFRFMQDGGELARGVEIRREIVNFVNILAIDKEMDISCNTHLNEAVNQEFDIGIYLDTHFAPGTENYLDWLSKHVKILYTSCASREDGVKRNDEYAKLLTEMFKKPPILIYKGFMGRIIFKCG